MEEKVGEDDGHGQDDQEIHGRHHDSAPSYQTRLESRGLWSMVQEVMGAQRQELVKSLKRLRVSD